MKVYDAILSLGGCCAAACQLRMYGLRPAAMPFDWVFMRDIRSVQYLTRAFESDFKGFLPRDRLVDLVPHIQSGTTPYQYLDVESGFAFIHHFHRPLTSDAEWEHVSGVMARRIKRMVAQIEESATALVILATPFAFDPAEAETLLNAIRTRFPKTQVDMALLQFHATFSNPLVQAEAWPANSPFAYGGKFAREVGMEFEKTSFEWNFLGEIALSMPKRKMTFLWKMRYKLWKRLSRDLLNAGLACKGVKF